VAAVAAGVKRSSALAAKWSTAQASLGETVACLSQSWDLSEAVLLRGIADTAASIFLSRGMAEASQHTICASDAALAPAIRAFGKLSSGSNISA
jgi:hypothetical protein